MSVQRWAEGFRGGGVRAVDGEWVTYADHVAALAEATHLLNDSLGLQRTIHEKALAEAEQRGYEHGHRVALEYFRAVVISDTYRPDTDHHVQTIAIPRLMRLIDLHKESPVPESDYAKGYAEALRQAREVVAGLPWKVAVSFGPIDCDESCEHGPCTCSGVMRPEAWMTGPADALAAIDALAAGQAPAAPLCEEA